MKKILIYQTVNADKTESEITILHDTFITIKEFKSTEIKEALTYAKKLMKRKNCGSVKKITAR